MAGRVVVLFAMAALVLSGGGIASAAPRYSDWSGVTYFAAVNTPAFEFANGISKDGLTFYYQIGDATSVNGEEIWIVQRTARDEPWGPPTRLPETINTARNDRAAFESPDGHWLYFASDRVGGKGDFDLYVSWRQHTHDASGWEAPTRLDSLNTTGFDSGPAVFQDDATAMLQMYFVSNPSGPQSAAVDIYRSVQGADGSWSTREKVNELNSTANEGHPYVRHDGLEIVFSSARLGGVDIWVATRGSTLEPWSTPELAAGANSVAPDSTPVLSWDGRTLYFTSGRSGLNGEIYYATRDKVTGKP